MMYLDHILCAALPGSHFLESKLVCYPTISLLLTRILRQLLLSIMNSLLTSMNYDDVFCLGTLDNKREGSSMSNLQSDQMPYIMIPDETVRPGSSEAKQAHDKV